ncbi:MAG: 3'-5' exonuclease [Terriglobales bacterium]
MLAAPSRQDSAGSPAAPRAGRAVDAYFSADVETDGPIPGEYSMLSFALVYAGSFDGAVFRKAENWNCQFSSDLRPISPNFQVEALRVNGIDRGALIDSAPEAAPVMCESASWVRQVAGERTPVLVAYPLSFDWSWLYWYYMKFAGTSPFAHSRCFDLKTAVALRQGIPIAAAGRQNLPLRFRPQMEHSHRALEDAKEQAEIFVRVFTERRDAGISRG